MIMQPRRVPLSTCDFISYGYASRYSPADAPRRRRAMNGAHAAKKFASRAGRLVVFQGQPLTTPRWFATCGFSARTIRGPEPQRPAVALRGAP